jgi:CelD/BcsL family acetyltransferase involved in cellulose biosynthesis
VTTKSVRGPVPGNGALTTEVVRDLAPFDALADEWAALYAGCPTATPFQSHAWLAAWARAYCRPGRLRVVVVRSRGRLVAAAPLHLERRGAWPVLTSLGGHITDFTDVLVAPDVPEAGEALARALLEEPGWRVIDLPQARPGAAALSWSDAWPGPVTCLPSNPVLELPVVPLGEVLTRPSNRTAATLRRKLRKADARGIEVDVADPDQVAGDVGTMLRLHAQQWAGRGGTPEHFTDRFAAHLTEAFPRLVADRQAHVVRYRLGGEVLAVQLDLIGHDFLGYYLAGISPKLRQHIDVHPVQLRTDMELALAAGVPRYSMLRGLEEYKLHWRPEQVDNARLLLVRPGLPGGAGLPLLMRARAVAAGVARERAPWLRTLRGRVRSWRRPR